MEKKSEFLLFICCMVFPSYTETLNCPFVYANPVADSILLHRMINSKVSKVIVLRLKQQPPLLNDHSSYSVVGLSFCWATSPETKFLAAEKNKTQYTLSFPQEIALILLSYA